MVAAFQNRFSCLQGNHFICQMKTQAEDLLTNFASLDKRLSVDFMLHSISSFLVSKMPLSFLQCFFYFECNVKVFFINLSDEKMVFDGSLMFNFELSFFIHTTMIILMIF